MEADWQLRPQASAVLDEGADTGSARPERLTDADMAVAVTKALWLSAGLSGTLVQGMVDRGQVTLCGEVQWQFQSDAAAVVSRWVAGVTGVTNLISVRSISRVEEPM